VAAIDAAPGEAVYLYCFTSAGLPPPQAPGVAGDPRAVHPTAGLAAVVGRVALAEFVGEAGENHLQDIGWLGPRACRHAAVVEQAMAAGPVYPLPFGTLFSSLAALDQEAERRRAEIAAVLRQVEGCEEWSVEGTLDRKQAVEYQLEAGLRSGDYVLPESIGRRHLEEQKLRRAIASGLNAWLEPQLADIQQTLSATSRDWRPRRLRDETVLHWAYLVPVEHAAAFGQAVAALGERHERHGLRFRLSGPWPPYTFAQAAP